MAEQENPMTKLLGYRKDDTDNIFWLVLYKNGKEDWKIDKEVRENEKWGELSCRISIPNRYSLGELPSPPISFKTLTALAILKKNSVKKRGKNDEEQKTEEAAGKAQSKKRGKNDEEQKTEVATGKAQSKKQKKKLYQQTEQENAEAAALREKDEQRKKMEAEAIRKSVQPNNSLVYGADDGELIGYLGQNNERRGVNIRTFQPC
eukprot:g53099.t1